MTSTIESQVRAVPDEPRLRPALSGRRCTDEQLDDAIRKQLDGPRCEVCTHPLGALLLQVAKPRHYDCGLCKVCGLPMDIVKPGQTRHPDCDRDEDDDTW